MTPLLDRRGHGQGVRPSAEERETDQRLRIPRPRNRSRRRQGRDRTGRHHPATREGRLGAGRQGGGEGGDSGREAYFDRELSVFIGRVGNHEVQIETTIQPVPRETMIAVGGRIMESLARR